ncbi:MAG: protein kinase [Myxococcales bacterium]|nr:protein kinase [Myxococcales bacterium]MCB9525142.1 protein kinase [Myxococcales bacterium]
MSVDPAVARRIAQTAAPLSPAARADFLDEACADDLALRAVVESLLPEPPTGLAEDPTRTVVLPPTNTGAEALASFQGAERFRHQRLLGEGGHGRVDSWFDRALRRSVAVKAAKERSTADAELLQQEAQLLAYLDHPGVVPIYDLIDGADGLVCVMKQLSGETLEARIARHREAGTPMPISEVLRIVTRVAETIGNAHDKGVAHLDLKPANILLERFGRVSVIDWGIAVFFEADPYARHLAALGEPTTTDVRTTSTSSGTPAYMPPEQFLQNQRLGPPADIYALGVVLFEALAGQRPFADQRTHLAIAMAKNRGAPPLRPLRSDAPEKLATLCARMLAPQPEDRPPSMEAVLAELAELTAFAAGSHTLTFEAGDVLMEQGTQGDTAYQVLRGAFDVIVRGPGGDQQVARLGPGEIVGELALLSDEPRSAHVVAAGPAAVRPIDWADVEEALSKTNPVIGQLLRNLAAKLLQANRQLQDRG